MIHTHRQRLDEAAEVGRSLIQGLAGAGLIVVDAELTVLVAEGEVHERAYPGHAGRRVSDVVTAGAWEVLEPRYAAALQGEAQTFEHAALDSVHWVRLAPICEDATPIGVMVVSQDMTTIAAERARVAESERRQRAVLDVLDEGVLVVDLARRLEEANAAACAILGFDLDTAREDPTWWHSLWARDLGDDTPLAVGRSVLASGLGVRDVAAEIKRLDGGVASLSVNYLPLLDEAGAISGLVVSFRDMTAREREHRERLESEDRLREAHEVARLASWEWQPETDEVHIFQALSENDEHTGTRAALGDLLAGLPEDAQREVHAQLEAVVRGTSDGSVTRYATSTPDGTVWMETRSRAVRAADGRLLCVRGTSQDVTDQELAERRATEARDFFQATLDSLPAHIAVLGAEGEIIMTNRAWRQFGADNGETEGGDVNYLAVCDSAFGEPVAAQAAKGLRAILSGARSEFALEYPCHSPTVERWFTVRAARFEGPGDARVVVSHDDITARHEAEEEVATQAALLDEVDVAVVGTDLSGRITHWAGASERLYGWTRAEAVGRPLRGFIAPADDEASSDLTADRWEGQYVGERKDGSTFPVYVRDRVRRDDEGQPTGRIGVAVDMSERVAAERALREADNYLSAVADSMGEGMFTLDAEGRLTYINEAAQRLLGWTGAELAGCRMHEITHDRRADGSPLPTRESPMTRARESGRTLRVEDDVFVHRDGRRLPVAYTASPFQTDDGIGGCVVVFRDISERKAHEESLQRDADKLLWIGRIQDALAEDRFVLYAQPIIDLVTREVVQRELLLRLREPGGEIVGPDTYLGIAEQYGLIADIDRWVIRHGVEIAANGLAVEINVSGRSIGDPTLLDHIEACLERSGADPTAIVFEITETALVQDEAAARVFATRLRALGCKLALDDFGTGYGGFTHLKQLPMDYLKIDIEFVRDLMTDHASRHVVEAVVALARAFGLQTVAEGVEDAETLDLLLELGVDFAQGYHIARPGPLAQSPAEDRR